MEEEEEEEEALRDHCRRMIRRVQSKQQQPEQERRRHGGAGGRQRRTESERRAAVGGGGPGVHSGCGDLQQGSGPDGGPPSLGRGCRCVPPQLITMLRLKTLKEEMRRAAEAELHDPAVCGLCEQQQAALALKSFIRRKKTQLRFQTLKGRLSTHWDSGFVQNLPKPFDAPLWIWEELLRWKYAGHSNLGLP